MTDVELSLDPETFHRLGHRAIDALAERMEGPHEQPVAVAACVRPVATDDALRMDVDALRAAVADDRALFQTPDLGCLLVRDGTLLPAAFAVTAPYLRGTNHLASGVPCASESTSPMRASPHGALPRRSSPRGG